MLINIFEWQKPLWRQLFTDVGNMPHAMLMAGPEGLGKLAFAQALTARLLCEELNTADGPDGMACGFCSSCTWLASGNHPDVRLIQPDELDDADSETSETPQPPASARKPGQGPIRVDQIRELADFVFIGSHRHGNRVAVIAPAEAMNPAAANALLKVLEEPPAGVYFILISSDWRRLIPTIRSRCRSILFGRPDPVLAEQWLTQKGVKSAAELLRLTGGAPLLAADWAEQGRLDACKKAIEVLADKPLDPVAMSVKWGALLKGTQGFGLPQLVETVQKWVYDLILLKTSGGLRYHQEWHEKLEKLSANASSSGLLACYNDLLRVRAVVRHPLNTQLFLEDMATRYLRALATGKT